MEPVRKSVYDVLKHNLKLAERKTFIHRYVYVGEHKNEDETEAVFRNVIKTINEQYSSEKLTGLLLLYTNYFLHVLDGDEWSLVNHIRCLFKHPELFGEIKLICFYHHINQRLFGEWGVRRAKPPILLEIIDQSQEFEEMQRYIGICITKFYNLAIELRQVDPEKQEPTKIGEIMPYMSQYLPECKLVQYVTHVQELFGLRFILQLKELVLDTNYNMEQVWPIRNDYVPYNVFESDTNPVENLPNMPGK